MRSSPRHSQGRFDQRVGVVSLSRLGSPRTMEPKRSSTTLPASAGLSVCSTSTTGKASFRQFTEATNSACSRSAGRSRDHVHVLRHQAHLADERGRFTLSPEDIALINPNTKTCPVFRSQADAELTKKIYRRLPVLIYETRGEAGNLWGMIFRQGLFNMTSDSGLFRRHAKLRDAGGRLEEMVWSLPRRALASTI